MTGIFLEAQIEKIKENIKIVFESDSGGHDYWHSVRVYQNALKLAESEECDKNVVAIAALLHDVDDAKLFEQRDYQNARCIMKECRVNSEIADKVIEIIKAVSFRGCESVVPESLEGKIVQDADRLDALGAIGIARTFAYGGSKGRCLYNPEISPQMDMTGTEYLSNEGSSVNHFYEKLFCLKDLMNTDKAKEIALQRDAYMRDFLEQFLVEWNGIPKV